MYVFLRRVFHIFIWRQFSKSWEPSFLPYPCSKLRFCFVIFGCFPKTTKQKRRRYQPLCVSFYYIIYSKYMFFWVIRFEFYCCRQFSKSWTPSLLPYPCSSVVFSHGYFFVFAHKKPWEKTTRYQPPCVSFYYIIYIVNICIFEYHVLQIFTDANFQKAGRLHSFPVPAHVFYFSVFCFLLPKIKNQKSKSRYQPLCVSFYYIILLVTTCIALKNIFHPPKNRP